MSLGFVWNNCRASRGNIISAQKFESGTSQTRDSSDTMVHDAWRRAQDWSNFGRRLILTSVFFLGKNKRNISCEYFSLSCGTVRCMTVCSEKGQSGLLGTSRYIREIAEENH